MAGIALHSSLHEHRSVAGGQARASVFGVSDGLVSNISLILGFAGSGVDASVVRLAGLAGLLAGSISMAAGEWVSVTAQNELINRELEVERRELARHPEAETAELTRLYESRGVPRKPAREVAEAVMRVPETALHVHAREELGVTPESLPNPWLVSVLSFVCFAAGAILPVLPWFVSSGTAATIASVAIGVVAAAVVGAAIARFAERGVVRSALRQVAILLVACGVTYAVGKALDVNVS
jgi:VIT1/CCC1 family predicted Fe2+/Mn2+ transporter